MRNKQAGSEPWTTWLLWDRQREYLQHSRGDKVRRAISPEASGLHSFQLKVHGWSVFPHACTLFKTPVSSPSKAFQTQEPQRSLLKQYLLVFQWDSWAPKKLAEFTRSLLLHGCLIKTGLFFFLGDYTPHNYVNVINISKYLIFVVNGLFNFVDANNISICFHWVSYFCIGTSRCNNGSCKIYSNIQSQPCSVWK